jgi:hypothetical protein
MANRVLHIKLKNEQHEHHTKRGWILMKISVHGQFRNNLHQEHSKA